jgi:DNA-binding response OmpR family regulator
MYRILLADDSKTIQKVLRLSLSEDRYQFDCFDEAESARSHLQRFGADVVLVDVGLPGGGGYEFCRRLKRDLDTAAIPVILLAGSLEPIDGDQMAWAGADGSLTKPFETSHLIEVVDEMAQRRKSRRQEPVEAVKDLRPDEPEAAPPVAAGRPGFLFELTREQCRPRFRILATRAWKRPAAATLSDEQFQAILQAVSEQLPQTLKSMLPDLTREVLRRRLS